MIKIIDNELPNNMLSSCIAEAENSKNYTVLHQAGTGLYGFKYSWMFFHSDKTKYIENENLKNLWLEVQKYLPHNIRLHRAYINAHTYGVEDSIHQDDPDLVNGLTVIIYLCSNWYPEWFGQTMFFESTDQCNNEIIQSVIPRFNRMIIFNKNIPHCVSPLSRRFSGIRLTCMFKVELLNVAT